MDIDDEPVIAVTALYGRCEIRSWFEFDGGKLIGMGSKKTYDRNGNLIGYEESPTGITMVLPNNDWPPMNTELKCTTN